MQHRVTFDLPSRDLGKADVHFTVKCDGKILGKLEVSRGSRVWYPKDMTYGHKVPWSEFDRAMRAYPRPERRKRP
jgi:hypothetical protein